MLTLLSNAFQNMLYIRKTYHLGGVFMNISFIVPSATCYTTIFGNIIDENGMIAVTCIGQCTGCTCACRCSCKAVDDIGFEW